MLADQEFTTANVASPPPMEGHGVQALHIPGISQGPSRHASALPTFDRYGGYRHALGLELTSGRPEPAYLSDFSASSIGQDDYTSGDFSRWFNSLFENSEHASSSGTGFNAHNASSSELTGALAQMPLHPSFDAAPSHQLHGQAPASAPPPTTSWDEQFDAGALDQQGQHGTGYAESQNYSTCYSPGILVSQEDCVPLGGLNFSPGGPHQNTLTGLDYNEMPRWSGASGSPTGNDHQGDYSATGSV
ncbi:hypothetical protein PLICRDRAFT_701081 [Plicaturopsis crispa FD-325 SS-3]|nr:hypothetical protein PLICRDRAFT_701081 [Plicaturopsis crispa FD-325 SS-3]